MDKIESKIKAIQAAGGVVFTKGIYNLNLLVERNISNPRPNIYNDKLYVLYRTPDVGLPTDWKIKEFEVTSIPGEYWLENPMNVLGSGAIAPGFYRSLWQDGYFRGERALIQINNIRAYRDNNKDKKYDFNDKTIMTWGPEAGFFLHGSFAGDNPNLVGKSSAGCIVIRNKKDYDTFFELVDLQKKLIKSNKFSLTLIHI